jgi:hypothetical protein
MRPLREAILSYCSEIRQVRPREGTGALRRVAKQRQRFPQLSLRGNRSTQTALFEPLWLCSDLQQIEAGNEGLVGEAGSIVERCLGNLVEKSQV